MPGSLPTYGDALFPRDEKEHQKLLGWTHEARTAADAARQPHMDKARRYYRLYRSYVKKRGSGDWRSRVFMPEAFNQVETILPRLVAQLPKFNVNPIGPEDVEPAKVMEFLLNHAAEQTYNNGSSLYVELVKVFKDALMYGTGILKVYHDQVLETGTEVVPVFEDVTQEFMAPVTDPETQMPMQDLDGNMVMEPKEVTDKVPVGFEPQPKEHVHYDGPVGECIDLFNFWVAPEADSIENARYCIHRVRMENSEVKKLIAEGTWQWPEMDDRDLDKEIFGSDGDREPALDRLSDIEMGAGDNDSTRKMCVVDEFWTDDGRQITVLNEKAVVRVAENPFYHRMKPFVRFTDYLMPHEFYGVGEIEAIEGLQDLVNSLTNTRIDEIKLRMTGATVFNPDHLWDLRDLQRKPGQTIRTRGDVPPKDVVYDTTPPEINSSAFEEVDRAQRMIERTTGASGVQQGTDSPINDTATGISIIQEMGANRFGFKSKVFELDPLKALARQFGSIVQQFTDSDRVVRMLGPQGETVFESVDPLSVQGALDYTIETASLIQSETVKRDQAMGLFNTLSPLLMGQQGAIDPMTGMPMPLPPGVIALIEDILEAYGKKQVNRYLQGVSPFPSLELPSASTEVPTEATLSQPPVGF